ncbi:MAG: hypothetical protein Fur0037_03170 [Planctomycetota bacterium]
MTDSTDTPRLSDEKLRAARERAIEIGRSARAAVRGLQRALEDALAADERSTMSFTMLIVRLFRRFRRDREIAELLQDAQAELSALDRAVEALRASGLALTAEPVASMPREKAPKRRRGSRWLFAIGLAQGAARRVDAIFEELRALPSVRVEGE